MSGLSIRYSKRLGVAWRVCHVNQNETADHGIYLIGNFHLHKVTRTDDLAVHQLRARLVEMVHVPARVRGRDVESRHSAPSNRRRRIPGKNSFEGRRQHMLRSCQHRVDRPCLALGIIGREEESIRKEWARDITVAWSVQTRDDGLDAGPDFGRGEHRGVEQHNAGKLPRFF